MKSQFLICISTILLFTLNASAQKEIDGNMQDSIPTKAASSAKTSFSYKKLILPGVMIGFGVGSLSNEGLLELNRSTRVEIHEHLPPRTSLDNYTQYAPAVIVYGLNSVGIEGKHNFKERTIIYATSQIVAAAFVLPLKHLVKEQRPDGSNNLSFPSGHTTTAFSSAQFMYREYKETNFWLAISGYPFAAFTGVYRTLNDKHWVGDVIAGAGFGILSTELAYWLYPKLSPLFSTKGSSTTTAILPVIYRQGVGLSLVQKF